MEMRSVPKAERERGGAARSRRSLQIDHLLERQPGQLSGGQRQRVAMGRALVRKPRIFLFDEPLSNLDAKLRVDMRTEIKKLHQRLGATIVYVTHDQIEAMTLATRIAVMRDGELQQLGTPAEIYSRPANTVRRRLHGLAAHEPRCRACLRSEGDSAWLEIAADGARPRAPACRPLPEAVRAMSGKEIIAGPAARGDQRQARRRRRRRAPVIEATRGSDRTDRPRYARGARRSAAAKSPRGCGPTPR